MIRGGDETTWPPGEIANSRLAAILEGMSGKPNRLLPLPYLQAEGGEHIICRTSRVNLITGNCASTKSVCAACAFLSRSGTRNVTVQNTIATIGMYVDLPKEFKGTHMSRFVEVLNAHGNMVHVENIPEILYAMQQKLQFATRLIWRWNSLISSRRQAPVSGREGLMDYMARFDATACGKEIDFVLGVQVGVTTLCALLESDQQVRRTQSTRDRNGSDAVQEGDLD